MNAEQIIIALLNVIVNAAPGYLALLTGHQTDAEALEIARVKIRAIQTRPAQDAIDDEVAKATRT